VEIIVVRETSSNVFEELPWGATIVNGDVLHPWQIIELWSDADLAAENIYRVERAPVPSDKKLISSTFVRNAQGVVENVLTLEDLPPPSVSPWQIRKALTATGLRQAVEDFVASQDQDVQDAWQYASSFEFDNPFWEAGMAALGKTHDDLVALFRLAASL
jgi:hypothetical protein